MDVMDFPSAQYRDFIGREYGPGPWLAVDQSCIDQFADVTLDHQFIHVDPQRASATPFGSTIAHGFLTVSLMPHLTEGMLPVPRDMVMAVNYGFDKLRFLAPVKVNERIRARLRVADIASRANRQFLVRQEITVEIEGGDRPALLCTWLALIVCE